MRPPVIRIRSDLDTYVSEQANHHGVTPSEFVNGVLEAHRFLDPKQRLGLQPETKTLLQEHTGKWAAFVMSVPGQPVMLFAGEIKKVGFSHITLEVPVGFQHMRFDLQLGWMEGVYLIADQARSSLREITPRVELVGIGVHHLVKGYMNGE
jgi:hypothetical protein